MGQTLLRLACERSDVTAIGALEAPGHGAIGAAASMLTGRPELAFAVADDAAAALASGGVLIEFTLPEPSLDHVRIAARLGTPVVLGTTGFSAAQQAEIESLTTRMACVQAPNMSVGVTALLEVVEQVAKTVGPSFDIEVVEAHHRAKRDAPSGTALGLARAAAAGRGTRLEQVGVYGREGITGERPAGQIGVMALRGGDVVGDHTVFFLGTGERIELTHRAQSREAFAAGALRAAAWVADRAPGLYSMRDVLRG
jgi:4-hydroxy-tetrahydrodipicolinate reductase